jgi:hypothetical protein
VLCDGVGTTGQAILRAIVAGERDAVRWPNWRLTAVIHGRLECESPDGDWKEEQVFILKQSIELSMTSTRLRSRPVMPVVQRQFRLLYPAGFPADYALPALTTSESQSLRGG